MTLPWLEPMTVALIPFVGPWVMPFHLKTNWWWGRHIQIFYDFRHHTMQVCFRVTVGSQIVVPQQLIYFFSLLPFLLQFVHAIWGLKPFFLLFEICFWKIAFSFLAIFICPSFMHACLFFFFSFLLWDHGSTHMNISKWIMCSHFFVTISNK